MDVWWFEDMTSLGAFEKLLRVTITKRASPPLQTTHPKVLKFTRMKNPTFLHLITCWTPAPSPNNQFEYLYEISDFYPKLRQTWKPCGTFCKYLKMYATTETHNQYATFHHCFCQIFVFFEREYNLFVYQTKSQIFGPPKYKFFDLLNPNNSSSNNILDSNEPRRPKRSKSDVLLYQETGVHKVYLFNPKGGWSKIWAPWNNWVASSNQPWSWWWFGELEIYLLWIPLTPQRWPHSENQVQFFENEKIKDISPTRKQKLHFIKIQPSSNIYTFWDITCFVWECLKLPNPKNVNILPS